VYERPSGLRDTVPLGAVLPIDRGSGGKVLLAWAADATRFEVEPRELAAIRKRGWAASVGEREAGVASVSAPVFDGPDTVAAVVSVSGPIDRLGQNPGRRLAAAVTGAAAALGATLRGSGNPPHVTAG
jgi:DNA-binding IclR family transcriptional regulator